MPVTKPLNWHIRCAADVIQQSGVIAYPTETVWGLGCDPWSPSALNRLLQLKGRSRKKGLILISGQVAHFSTLIEDLPEHIQQRFKTTFERATTWLVPDPLDYIPPTLKGEFSSIAVRITHHPLVSALTQYLGHPIVSTSANVSGHPSALTPLRVRQYFRDNLDYILPGALGGERRPSQIIDLMSHRVLRD